MTPKANAQMTRLMRRSVVAAALALGFAVAAIPAGAQNQRHKDDRDTQTQQNRGTVRDNHRDHDDHDDHEKAGRKADAHAGHDHGDHDDHDEHEETRRNADAHAEHDHDDHDEHEETRRNADAHAEHDHDDHEKTGRKADAHAGHDHGDHDDHDEHAEAGRKADAHAGHDHGDENGLKLTPEQRRQFGIEMTAARPGVLTTDVELHGEVVLNADHVVHVVPRVPGVAVDVGRRVGDRVAAGEPLAVLDSTELGQAKVAFLTAQQELELTRLYLARAQTVHDNTGAFLQFLEDEPGLTALRQLNHRQMGENRSLLVSAYAEFVLARTTYEREKALRTRNVSSEEEFLAAENALKTAEAAFIAARDSVSYAVSTALEEARQAARRAELGLMAARHTLRLMGVGQDDIDTLGTHGRTDGALPEDLTRLAMNSPIDGIVVDRHLALGEKVTDESDVFTIADLDTVWVNLAVYLKDIALLNPGTPVILTADHSGAQTRGSIDLVTPFVDEATRTATARVVLDNRDGRWRPGAFVTGRVSVSTDRVAVVVPRDAVQMIDGESVVFVEHEGTFEARPVVTGRSDRENIEIVDGVAAGTAVVSHGAFELKAKLVTGSMDAHAGHGH